MIEQFYLIRRFDPNWYLPLIAYRVDLGVMAMKGYSTFSRAEASSSDSFVSYPATKVFFSWIARD